MGRKLQKVFDQRRLPDVIRRPLINEKATLLLENNQYTFDVIPDANKIEIKVAVETLFSVKVKSVNTHTLPAKARRVGKFAGKRPQYKRAIVTLAQGDKITLFPDV
ncbi:ribosomal protein L23 [Synechococcus sp. PCC 7502]|uniref:50S ribosomal protein L23 n=1 Tax=Synechococcus sp. PCC 7502 TaxID=1173263 RepID=UPI00029F8A3B|nr:50S ribosomal protein L23 [Synechococcus sp. PCC 7502]AFY72901.1 ribosomal protein L23 [Synechococcus sp. PCC 7502]